VVVDVIAMRDHFGVMVGVSFGGGTGGGVWLLVSTASAALYVHYSVYVLEPSKPAWVDSSVRQPSASFD
jgi:hypothetical protein